MFGSSMLTLVLLLVGAKLLRESIMHYLGVDRVVLPSEVVDADVVQDVESLETNAKPKRSVSKNWRVRLYYLNEKYSQPKYLRIASLFALTMAVWNFFAPGFGGEGVAFFGALIPVLVLTLDALVLYPGIQEYINMRMDWKEKVDSVTNSVGPRMGLLTLTLVLVRLFIGHWPLI